MADSRAAAAREWLIKALHDLCSARLLSRGEEFYLDVAIYLCQQGAEKSAKGFLVYHGTVPERTHDVGRLLQAASRFEPEFAFLLDTGDSLTPYATMYRYPDEPPEPDREQVEDALEAGWRIYYFVLSVLPGAAHPSVTEGERHPQ